MSKDRQGDFDRQSIVSTLRHDVVTRIKINGSSPARTVCDSRCYTRYDLKKRVSAQDVCAEVRSTRMEHQERGEKRYIYIQIDESRGNEEPATLLDTIN